MLNQLLSKLGGNSKVTVGVSVSPSVGLEMIEINPKTKIIEKYSCRPLEYDYTKREIADYNQFIEVLKKLFEDLGINPKSNIVLTLPSVHYGLMSLPVNLSDEGVTSSIISDVEQTSYIFKRQDPVVSWIDAYPAGDKEDREVLYGVIQQSALDEINAACTEVGCTLVAIETAHNSLLKALQYNQLAEEQMAPNTTWILMVINQNSYSMITLSGQYVVEYREEPLALRSFVGDEIYEAIMSSAQLTLQTVPSNYLYIVSETDMVSAEVLSMKIPYDGNIKFLEINKYVQNPIMQASYNILPNVLLKTSPEVIGAGIYFLSSYPAKFNLTGQGIDSSQVTLESAPKISLGSVEIELSSSFLKKFAIIALIIIILPSLLLIWVANTLTSKQQTQLDEINNKIEADKTELQGYEEVDRKDDFDVKLETNTIQAINRAKLIYYSAIGANIPSDTWLIYLRVFAEKKVDMIGRSQTADSVYAFYKGLKMSVINSDLRLNKLEMSADTVGNLAITDYNSIKPKFYEFEITNLGDEALRRLEEELNQVERDEEGNLKSSDEGPKRRRGFLFDDFLKLPNAVNNSETTNVIQQPDNNDNNNKPPKSLPANLESIEKF
ncbi:hypothetical protein IKE67_03435 [bacterium]|nr:hypothetical protein [bacterium]